jgi:hypothetical protein
MKQFNILILIIFLMFIIPIGSVGAAMSSNNYKIDADSINIGGGQSSSANYKMEGTIGEVGTGDSESDSYKSEAGYQAMWDYPPYLSFSLNGNYVAFGVIDYYSTSTATTGFTVATNAHNGYEVTIAGNTLTHSNESDTISAIGTAALSSTGTEQFGINLVDNSDPNVGADPSGGSGSAAAGYDTADYFKFVSGNTIASASSFTYPTTFTISYLGNVAIDTKGGWYTTVLTLVATGRY